jgi:hypothetical protein
VAREFGRGLPLWRPWRIFRKGSGNGNFSLWGLRFWRTWRRVRLPGTLRAGWRGSGDCVSLSQEAQWKGSRVGLLSPGNLKDEVYLKNEDLRDILNALQAEGSADGASFSMGAPLGEPGGGFLLGDPEVYERRALGTGTSLYGGSVKATWGGLIYWNLKIWLNGLWRWSVFLRGSSVKETWRGLPAGKPEGYLEKFLWTGIST